MDILKKHKIEAKGWKVGDVDEFLGLDKADMAIVEMKVALALAIVAKRKQCHWTQLEMAKAMKSSQSRIAKIEHADPTVSMELMLRYLFTLGVTRQEVAQVLS